MNQILIVGHIFLTIDYNILTDFLSFKIYAATKKSQRLEWSLNYSNHVHLTANLY